PEGQRELGGLAKVRYLVLGSITPLASITVNARLVDVRSGLVVQTAKVSAPTPEALLKELPRLGTLLLMSDAERLALEQVQGEAVAAAAPAAALPPPPPEAGPPPPPPVVADPQPPAFGGLQPHGFLTPPPAIVAEP